MDCKERNGGFPMSFKLHVAFSGLLDFIPNQDQSKDVRLCIVLPNAPNHNARISALRTGRLRLGDSPVTDEISFDNMRVSLRVRKANKAAGRGPLNYQAPMIDGRIKGVIPFEMIAGLRANETNPMVVSASASAAVGVRAQILIEEGSFALDMPNGAARLELPATLTGHSETIEIAPRTFMTIDDVESAQLVTSPLSSSPGQEVAYDISDDGGGEAGILLSYLCTQMMSPGAHLTNDDDFKFHYRLLNPTQQEALGGARISLTPVPTVLFLPPESHAERAATQGPFKAMVAGTEISGDFTLRSLSAGGCNCAGSGGKPMPFDLDAFGAKAVPAEARPDSVRWSGQEMRGRLTASEDRQSWSQGTP
jgi:hypothetical protein